MRWGMEGAIDLLLRALLKLRTSFSSAREPPMRKERLLRASWWLLLALVLLSVDIK